MRPSPSEIPTLLQSAVQLHGAGSLDQAAALYERVLALDPKHPDALHLLGVVALARGDAARAEKLIAQAIKRNPSAALYHVNLGSALLEQGRPEQALEPLRRALRLQPDSVEALNNLANALQRTDRTEEALPHYLRVIELRPDHLSAYPNLASAYLRLGQGRQAFDCYLAYLARRPDDPEILERVMDLALEHKGDAAAALRFGEPYLRCKGSDARAHWRVGLLLDQAGDAGRALEHLEAAARLDPEMLDAQVNLGLALHNRGRYGEAIARFRRAAELAPGLGGPHSNLALPLAEMGMAAEAVQACRRALEIEPDFRIARSNLVLFLHYLPEADPRMIYEEHRLWERQHAPAAPRGLAAWDNDRDPGRRLRVGYLSPDFRRHSVAFFFEPLLEAHDRGAVEPILYSDVIRPDEVTARLKGRAAAWRDTAALSDEELERLIRQDRVDILVDLAGHTSRGRPGVLARKPAPVQAGYLGYPDTTGLRAVDWRITDAAADPAGEADALHAERLLRLPRVFLAYRPDPDSPAPERPAADAGRPFTFASFNNLAKTTPQLIALWARILDAVPESRLMLKSVGLRDTAAREHLLQEVARCGVGPERLLLVPPLDSHAEHLARYRDADLCLDTWPYNGTTTTCEALWMGVPALTLAGATHCSRVGASVLGSLGLARLVASSPDEYVAKAAALARDRAALRELGEGLRSRMRASPLLDGAGLAAALEAAYREMWQGWCRQAAEEEANGPRPGPDRLAVRIRGDVEVCVPASVRALTPYVLLEQEDWFEDEIRFLRRWFGPGARALDVGANFGVYTLTLARRAGPQGKVWAVEPAANTAAWLRASLERNGLANVELVQAGLAARRGPGLLELHPNPELNRIAAERRPGMSYQEVELASLDDCASGHGIRNVDFVKVDAEGHELAIIKGGRGFLARESPLLMFEIKHGTGLNLGLVGELAALGYAAYRLVPGLELLEPLSPDTALDGYQLNLLFCKPERARTLAAGGWLAATVPPAGPAPESAWQAWLEAWPYGRELAEGWVRGRQQALPGWKENLAALECYARAHDASLPPGERLAALERSRELIEAAARILPTPGRAQTRARVAWERGLRERAVELADAAIATLPPDADATVEPFVPACPRYEALAGRAGTRPWLLASLMEQRERLAAFSSYFRGADALQALERLRELDALGPEMERRRQLLRMRGCLQYLPEPAEVLSREGATLNPEFWRGEIPV